MRPALPQSPLAGRLPGTCLCIVHWGPGKQVLQTPEPYLAGTPTQVNFSQARTVALVRLVDVTLTCLHLIERPLPDQPAVALLPNANQLSPVTLPELHASLACECPHPQA